MVKSNTYQTANIVNNNTYIGASIIPVEEKGIRLSIYGNDENFQIDRFSMEIFASKTTEYFLCLVSFLKLTSALRL